jgi:hypothetical protein
MDHTVWLADLHNVWHSDDLSRSESVLRVSWKTLVELQEHLRVSGSPSVDLADIRVTAGSSTYVVRSVNEAWHTLVEASPEGSVQMIDRVSQM